MTESIWQQFEGLVTDWRVALLCLILAVIARLSPAGRWNYKRTQWLQKRNEKYRKKYR